MHGETSRECSGPRRCSFRLLIALAALGAVALAGLAAQSADAAKPLRAPHPGPWKIIAAANTPNGLEVRGGVIGSFRVTKAKTIAGFHLRFTEEGESSLCAGGQEGDKKSGTIKFAAGASAPIIEAKGQWVVAVDTGSLGGGSLQGAEVSLLTPDGASSPGSIFVTLASPKDKPSGNVEWNEQQCGVAFVVKPG